MNTKIKNGVIWVAVTIGIFRHIPRNKGSILSFHQSIGQIALLFIGIHACLLMYDNYQPYSLTSILVPFTSPTNPILTGLGTIAAYLLIIVIFTSDFMKVIGRSLWKKTHYLVFPLWFLAAIHGLFLGTDSQTQWAEMMYASTSLSIILATLYLAIIMNRKKKQNGVRT